MISPTKMTKALLTVTFLALTSVSASAASLVGLGNIGTYIGTFNGNDSEEWFDTQLNLDLDLQETISPPATSEGFLSIFNVTLSDTGGIIAGQWAYTGPETITHLVFDVGPYFSVYEFTDGANSGFFNTSESGNKPIGDLTVYSSPAPVPLPAAVWLLMSGCVGLVGLGRRRNT